jgi:hypothetical protein
MYTNSENVPYRFNGMYWEIRKDFLNESVRGCDSEMREEIWHATDFAGGKGKFVNLDKILEQVSTKLGRAVAKELRAALVGEPEDLPLIATGEGLAAEMAKYRLEHGSLGVPLTRRHAKVIQDDSKVYPRRSAGK